MLLKIQDNYYDIPAYGEPHTSLYLALSELRTFDDVKEKFVLFRKFRIDDIETPYVYKLIQDNDKWAIMNKDYRLRMVCFFGQPFVVYYDHRQIPEKFYFYNVAEWFEGKFMLKAEGDYYPTKSQDYTAEVAALALEDDAVVDSFGMLPLKIFPHYKLTDCGYRTFVKFYATNNKRYYFMVVYNYIFRISREGLIGLLHYLTGLVGDDLDMLFKHATECQKINEAN